MKRSTLFALIASFLVVGASVLNAEETAAPKAEAQPKTEAVQPPAPEVKPETKVEVKPEVKTETKQDIKQEAKEEPEAEPKPELAGYVVPLQGIVPFYEREIAAAKKLIDQWNTRAGLSVKKEAELNAEASSLTKEIDEKKASDPKKFKKEIKALNSRLGMVTKQQKDLQKDLVAESRKLAGELGMMSKDVQISVKDVFSGIQQSVKDFYKQ